MRFNCWRVSTEDKGIAVRKAPTKMPAGREKPEHVGVLRRNFKGLRACQRQHLRRIPANETQLLACLDGRQRHCGEEGANKLMSIIKKRMFTLYKKGNPRGKSEEPIAVNVNLKDSVIQGIERDFTQGNRSIVVDMHS